MLVLDRPTQFHPETNSPDDLQTLAIGLGTVQLLLDLGRTNEAKATLRLVREELQSLRRSPVA